MNRLFLAIMISLASCGNYADTREATDTATTQLIMDSLQTKGSSTKELPEFLQKKATAGIDFFAVGQEPGWTLDLDMQSQFSFSSYEGISMNSPAVNGITKGDTSFYRMKVEMGELKITIIHQKCQDIMSGEEYPYQVKVSIKRGIDLAFKDYEGCGRFLR